MLAGCGSVSVSQQARELPAPPQRWTEAGRMSEVAGAVPLQRWWTAFGDPGLSQLVEAALAANPDLAAAVAAVAQARALRDVARAATGPAVDASAAVQRGRAGSAPAGTTVRAGLDAGWDADWFGRRAAALRAGDADVAASEANLGLVRLTLAAEVAATYFEGWGARERLRVAQQSLAAQLDSLSLTQWRVQAGLASALDLETARAALEQTRASLPALEVSIRRSMHALALLTGQAPGADLPDPPATAPEPPTAWTLPVPADVLRQRPDVAAAQARLQAAFARADQAEAARWPTLRLGGSLSLAAPRVADLFDVTALTRSLALNLAATVFDGGAAQAQARAQAAAAEQARAALAATLLEALRDVEDALVALAGDQQRLLRLQDAVTAAQQAEQLATQRYTAGLIDYRALLEAQRTLLALQSDLAAARTAWAVDHVRLVKALGGGWSPSDAAPSLAAATVQP
ncbi:MAG: efflux transporter outer membrane subunit [Tepidimonas sp.]|uniref:efflux transporter outer membrane subunit n=1 Tax=Tepidimonas sp. TaxID=2002775 RepID=UPI00259DF54E|nr:efflux transporter outer membrane subunit [Tepidimonas sp.]MDM7457043.1 efflux transporter outer membrane subunit [Tepidimonas sp.]